MPLARYDLPVTRPEIKEETQDVSKTMIGQRTLLTLRMLNCNLAEPTKLIRTMSEGQGLHKIK